MGNRRSAKVSRSGISAALAAIFGWLIVALIVAKIAHAATGQSQPWVYIPFAIIGVIALVYGLTRKSRIDDGERLD